MNNKSKDFISFLVYRDKCIHRCVFFFFCIFLVILISVKCKQTPTFYRNLSLSIYISIFYFFFFSNFSFSINEVEKKNDFRNLHSFAEYTKSNEMHSYSAGVFFQKKKKGNIIIIECVLRKTHERKMDSWLTLQKNISLYNKKYILHIVVFAFIAHEK